MNIYEYDMSCTVAELEALYDSFAAQNDINMAYTNDLGLGKLYVSTTLTQAQSDALVVV